MLDRGKPSRAKPDERTLPGGRGVFLRVVLGTPRPRVARVRTCGDEHVGQHENKEETTAAPAGEKSMANCNQDEVQDEDRDEDQDEAKFKSRYERHELCGQHDAKKLSIMTENGIGGRLNKITVTRFDVMCLCFVKKGKLRKKVCSVVVICQRKSSHRKEGIFICFEDNAGVIVNVKREVKGLVITRPVSQEHLGEVSRQVNMIVMDDRQGKEA